MRSRSRISGSHAPRSPPCLGEELVDQLAGLAPLALRALREQLGEEEVRARVRHVRRAVADHHAPLGLGKAAERAERLDERVRVADAVLAAVLRIAAVGAPIRGRREVAAHLPVGQDVADRHVADDRQDRVGERAAVALRHQHHHAHARRQLVEEPAQLADAQGLAPERDRVVGEVAVVLVAVVGDVEEEGIAGGEARAVGLEPRADGVLARRPQPDAVELRVLVDDLRAERSAEAAVGQQPESRLRRRLARREIGLGIVTVAAEDHDVAAGETVLAEHAEDLPHVLEVRAIVALALPAAVHEHGAKAAVPNGKAVARERRSGDDVASRNVVAAGRDRGPQAGRRAVRRRRRARSRAAAAQGKGGARNQEDGEQVSGVRSTSRRDRHARTLSGASRSGNHGARAGAVRENDCRRARVARPA